MLLKIGVGIDADFNSLNYAARNSLTNKIEVETTGTLLTLSGRIPIDFSFNTRKFGIGFRVIPMFSFFGEGEFGDAIINGPELPTLLPNLNDTAGGETNPIRLQWEQALKEDSEYQASGFALEIHPIYFAYYF